MKKVIIILMFTLISAFWNLAGYAEEPSFLSDTPLATQNYLKNSPPLNSKQLLSLVSGNTEIGYSCRKSLYELYFYPDGNVIFQKNRQEIYMGKWWVNGNNIFSQWKSYQSKSHVLSLQYFHVLGNVYIVYNNNDACGPKGSFGHPFMLIKGDPFSLKDSWAKKAGKMQS